MNIKSDFIAYFKDESGATMIEYSLISALISVVAISALGEIGDSTDRVFRCTRNVLNGVFVNDGRGPCAPWED